MKPNIGKAMLPRWKIFKLIFLNSLTINYTISERKS